MSPKNRFPIRRLLAAVGLLYVSLVVLIGSPACDQWRDCEATASCEGDLERALVAAATRVDGKETGKACRQCFREYKTCTNALTECTTDEACQRAARCFVTANPREYDACLYDLKIRGFSSGNETSRPWEGEEFNKTERQGLVECFKECNTACRGSRWACVGKDSPASDSPELGAALTIRNFPLYGVARNVSVRVCPRGTCAENAPWTEAEDAGVTEIEVPASASLTPPSFEIQVGSGTDDATTYVFHTGHLPAVVDDEPWPLAAYIVERSHIHFSNQILGVGSRLLKTRSQLVILPDSCAWEERTAEEVTFSAKPSGATSWDRLSLCGSIEQPSAEAGDGLPDETTITPCTWYGDGNGLPLIGKKKTSTFAGGIVGLKEEKGGYDIVVCDSATHQLVSYRRNVLLKKDTLTLLRTWPMTKDEQENQGDLEELCAAQ